MTAVEEYQYTTAKFTISENESINKIINILSDSNLRIFRLQKKNGYFDTLFLSISSVLLYLFYWTPVYNTWKNEKS